MYLYICIYIYVYIYICIYIYIRIWCLGFAVLNPPETSLGGTHISDSRFQTGLGLKGGFCYSGGDHVNKLKSSNI